MDANRQIEPDLAPHWRVYRQCMAEIVRVLRQSVLRGRPMTLPNVRRLFERRWRGVTRALPTAEDRQAAFAAGLRRGRVWLTAYYPLNVPGAASARCLSGPDEAGAGAA
ncbi:hypothetical protein ACERK3_18325 [Phycisphaerales bacterium AB-hyl4]|uniref:Uncharacterized protein n=1 Tax=Natronomicrosphaera hydrolytica TaxID=3242702 RepID=A0ABV4UCE4_9BACT